MADLRGKTLGKYTLQERIGRGGMSDVYWAAPQDGGFEVAIKVLTLDSDQAESEVFLARFQRETEIIRQLKHPHILPILDFGHEDEFVYFVTRLITGGTLADVIRSKPLDAEAAYHWVRQIAAALDHAHAEGVIHRDLKPSNVLIDEAMNAYLMDFGIAKLSNQTSGLTQTGNVIGTPAYMAPEQWRDQSLDARTDVYGLGIMTYLLLTGHTPFEAETAHAMMYYHLDELPPAPRIYVPGLAPAVEKVVLKALAKKPEDRYVSAGALATDLQHAVEGQPTLAEQAPIAALFAPHAPTPLTIPRPDPPTNYRPRTATYPIPEHLRRQQSRASLPRWMIGGGLGVVALLLVAFGVLAFGLLRGGANTPPASTPIPTSFPPTPSPIVTPNERPIDVPRIRLDSPGEMVVAVGEGITIQVAAFDTQGVTRIELRRFGVVLDDVVSAAPAGDKQLTATLVYIPDSPGQHRLEVLAFRGELPGDARYVTVTVQ